jgi:hypothetical protein
MRCHDTHPNDIVDNDTQHIRLIYTTVGIKDTAFYHYAECRHDECSYAECCYGECRYGECRYGECRYAECRGARGPLTIVQAKLKLTYLSINIGTSIHWRVQVPVL